MEIREGFMYTKTHEWVRGIGDGIFEVGITDYAQSELGDLVFISLPEVGDTVDIGVAFSDVESVKAVSDIYSPVTGVVCEVNEDLTEDAALINEDPYGSWLIRVNNVLNIEEILTAEQYRELVDQFTFHIAYVIMYKRYTNMIRNEQDYWKEFYKQMKDQEDLHIVKFSPHEIELSNGEVLKANPPREFDRNIVEDILSYNRRTRDE